MMRFQNKVALVSGGGTGIGRATALAFAREGAMVAICGRRKEPLEKTVKDIQKEGGQAIFFTCDVSRVQEVEKVVSDTVNKFGRIDILFNNAGINRPSRFAETTDDDINILIDTNVKGQLWMMRAVLRQMLKQGKGGAIVNMSSQLGLIGHVDEVVYCASKGAISNMTRALALEVTGDGIRVNAVCPGAIDTDMLQIAGPEGVASFIGGAPINRAADPMEVAQGVLFLASEQASYIAGANLVIDGGFTAGK